MKWNQEKLNKATDLVRILKKPIYKRILDIISDRGEMTVTQLFVYLRLEQAAVSQMLSHLRRHDLVFYERNGKNFMYSVNHERLAEIADILEAFALKPTKMQTA